MPKLLNHQWFSVSVKLPTLLCQAFRFLRTFLHLGQHHNHSLALTFSQRLLVNQGFRFKASTIPPLALDSISVPPCRLRSPSISIPPCQPHSPSISVPRRRPHSPSISIPRHHLHSPSTSIPRHRLRSPSISFPLRQLHSPPISPLLTVCKLASSNSVRFSRLIPSKLPHKHSIRLMVRDQVSETGGSKLLGGD